MMPRFRRPILRPRRRFPPSRRPPIRRRTAKIALDTLREAHTLLAHGKPKEAAAVFSQLADAATKRGIPRADQLYLQAGRALIYAEAAESGLDQIRQALTLMAETNQMARLPNASRRILTELRDHGLAEEAEVLETEIQSLLSKHGLSLATSADFKKQRNLPVKCPYCGGSVHPDEVEWVQRQAMCAYCGSRLTEKQ